MAETIDKVQVEVEATAKGTSQVFSQLTSQLNTLKTALSGLDTSKLQKAQTAINPAGMTKAERDITSSANKIKQALAGLEAYKNAALSGDSSSLTSFNRRVVAIQSAVDTLREKMQQMGVTKIETSQFTQLKNQSDELDAKLQGLKSQMSDVLSGKTSMSSNQFAQLTDDIVNARTELQAVTDQMQQMVGSGNAYINADTLTANLETAKAEVQSFVNATNNAKPQLDTGGIKDALSGIKANAEDAVASLKRVFSGLGLSSGIKNIGSSLSKVKETLSGIGSAATKAANTGFMKILRYGFGIRSLYVLFRRLKEAIKDSFTQLQYSGAEFETTRANIESLKNSLMTLKYQFGAAFEPIFNTIAPALQTFINYLVAAMNTLSAFFAKLTGRSTYSKVAVATAKVASGAGSASKAVGELNKQLQGFDELNNLDLDSGSGGSGGGGGSSSGDNVTYEEASVESALGSFASNLADMIKAGDWGGVGTAISDKITDALNSINWTTIKNKATKFGTNVANFFNGFITTDMFSSIGTTIAEAVNTVFTGANAFGTTLNWTNIGTSIGTGISSFFKTADFSLYGETVHTWVGGILDAGISLLENTDFEEIGKKLGDFIESVQVSDLLSKVKTLGSKIITALGKAITGFQNNTSEKAKLETAIGGLLGVLVITKNVPLTLILGATIGGVELGGKLYEWATGNKVNQSFTEEIGDIFEGFFGKEKIKVDISECLDFVVADMWSGTQLSKLQTGIVTALRSALAPATLFNNEYFRLSIGDWIVFDGVSTIITQIQAIGEKIKTAFSNIWNGQTFSEAMVGANGMSSEAAQNTKYSSGLKKTLQDLGKNIVDGVKEGLEIQAKVTVWSSPVALLYTGIVNAIRDKFGIHSPAKAMYEYGKYIFLGIVEGFKNAMTSFSWSDIANDLYNYFSNGSSNKMTGSASGKIGYDFSGTTSKHTVTINTKMTGQARSKADVDNLKTSFINLNTEASKTNEATYKANVGGKIAEITDLDTWKQKFTSLYEKWQSKSATMRASVGGQMESIDDTDTWITKITNLATEWAKSKTTTSMNVTSDVGNLDGSGGYLDRLTKAANTWKNTKPTATFTTKLDGTLKSASEIDTVAKSFQTLGSNYDKVKGSHSSSWSISFGGASVESIKSYADAAYKLYQSFYEDDHTATWTMTLSGSTSGVQDFINNFVAKLNEKMKTVTFRANFGALGGVITHGMMKHIPQYAEGTLNAGSVFVAGEHGPEVMGHINGRTEILNRSQIGSIIHSSFVTAMSQFGNRLLASPESVAYSGATYNGYNSTTNNNGDGVLLAEQNELLRQQNDLLAQLLEKPTGITSRDVFNATRSEANNYYRRTGTGAFLS